ncbi:MAG: 6-carboxytetrahydropterin synthase [Phycisphaerales bacterium]|nr:6-carboxytetrahydropterin synthase [Phycisphaerales bacterium]
MFAIEVASSFHASHALRLPTGNVEDSHAHHFHVTVKLAAEQLDATETVIDFHIVERFLSDILAPWQNKNLNTFEPFHSKYNPTAERIAQQIGEQLQAALAKHSVHLVEVRLTEAPGCTAIWTPE